MAFHFGLPHSEAGFLGGDVFFVLSGYLITSLLLARIERGRIAQAVVDPALAAPIVTNGFPPALTAASGRRTTEAQMGASRRTLPQRCAGSLRMPSRLSTTTVSINSTVEE